MIVLFLPKDLTGSSCNPVTTCSACLFSIIRSIWVGHISRAYSWRPLSIFRRRVECWALKWCRRRTPLWRKSSCLHIKSVQLLPPVLILRLFATRIRAVSGCEYLSATWICLYASSSGANIPWSHWALYRPGRSVVLSSKGKVLWYIALPVFLAARLWRGGVGFR